MLHPGRRARGGRRETPAESDVDMPEPPDAGRGPRWGSLETTDDVHLPLRSRACPGDAPPGLKDADLVWKVDLDLRRSEDARDHERTLGPHSSVAGTRVPWHDDGCQKAPSCTPTSPPPRPWGFGVAVGGVSRIPRPEARLPHRTSSLRSHVLRSLVWAESGGTQESHGPGCRPARGPRSPRRHTVRLGQPRRPSGTVSTRGAETRRGR